MGFTMQGWHSTFLGLREFPRDISDFEMKYSPRTNIANLSSQA